MKKTARIPLRVVFYRDESDKKVWVAHCLEFDLLGHGKTQKAAMKLLSRAVLLQFKNSLESGNIENLFNPAPAEYQLMYAKGRDIADAELKIELHCDDYEIDEVDAREYDDGYADSEADDEMALA